jgi:hypothetical protein
MLQRIMEAVLNLVRVYGFNEKFQFWYIFKNCMALWREYAAECAALVLRCSSTKYFAIF